MIRQSTILLWLLLLLLGVADAAETGVRIGVLVSGKRVARGERVEITIRVTRNGAPAREPVNAVLLRPAKGVERLALQASANRSGMYRTEVLIREDAMAGLYVIHAWTGAAEKPDGVGKATFLLERMVVDFLISSTLDQTRPAEDLTNYLNDFQQTGFARGGV